MPLLELRNLTVRFGGLTAVNGVNCAVDEGQVYSIIGPNGAGKTTVFNAITGIYQPTEGAIAFASRPLRRQLHWGVAVLVTVVGVVTALAAALLALGPDDLWRATIKRNYTGPDNPFSYARVWHDAVGFLHGQLALVPQAEGRFAVVTPEGRRTLGFAENSNQAEELRGRLTRMMNPAERPVVAQRNGRGIVQAADGSTLGEYDSADVATANLARMAEIGRDIVHRRRLAWLALVVGLAVGSSGAFAVWSRARGTPDVVTCAGIARTFQNIRLFQNMTVLENVLTGMDRHYRHAVGAMALRLSAVRRDEQIERDAAMELLEFVGLADRASALAKNLPYGDQRRLEIARALATRPRLVLLDEPAAGMNPAESAELTKLIDKIRRRGVTVLLIEHHMKVVMGISDRIAVLDYGVKIAEGTPDEVRANPEVIKAYLGSQDVG